jgi:transposase
MSFIYVAMYIDIVPNRNSPPAILLRESYREDGKVKKRTLANLSRLPSQLIDAIRAALSGPVRAFEQLISGPLYGVVFALWTLAQQCGLIRALGTSKLARLVIFLVIARIAHQGSRLSAVRWMADHAITQVLKLNAFDEDDLYAALDWAARHQRAIEDRLYHDYCKRRGRPPTLVLYDVTSSYLEGEENAFGEYGYNRDGKKGKKQVVIGLLTGDDGEPLSVEVFRGSTADPETFQSQIRTVVERFGIQEITFVGDRGMIKSKSKTALKDVGFSYITALTDPQVRRLLKDEVLQPGLFDETVAEVEHKGKRLILRRDPATFQKEQHRRNDKIQQLARLIGERNTFVAQSQRAKPEAGLKNLSAWSTRHKLNAFVTLSLEGKEIRFQIDETAKNENSLLDGCYCIESDVSTDTLDAQTIHDRYKDLQMVERNFRACKTSLLEIRPIFVRTEDHTRGHVFIAMLSLKVVRLMEQRLHNTFGTTDQNAEAETIESSLAALSRITLNDFESDGQRIPMLLRPDARQQRILSALHVTLQPPV